MRRYIDAPFVLGIAKACANAGAQRNGVGASEILAASPRPGLDHGIAIKLLRRRSWRRHAQMDRIARGVVGKAQPQADRPRAHEALNWTFAAQLKRGATPTSAYDGDFYLARSAGCGP